MHHGVAQRWYLAVGFGRQAFEPRVAGVHDESVATGFAHRADKVAHKAIALGCVLSLVNANSVLDGDGHPGRIDRVHHRLDAISHQLRLGHQARAKRAALHPLARATAVQVDLAIAPLLAQLGALGQVGRLAAAQLQCQRMLFGIELQVPRHVAMDQCARRHHFGVEQRVAGQQAMKVAAMPIGPVHHRGDRQLPAVCVGLGAVAGDGAVRLHGVNYPSP